MSDLDKKYTICLDLINNIQNEKMRFSLSDNETSDFYINITKSTKKVDLTYKTVKLYVVKPNKNVIYTTVTPYTECNDTNVFYCDLPNDFKNIKGTYYAQMLVEDMITGEKVVAPSKFSYIVESDIMSEMYEVADTEENKNILDSILSDLADLKINRVTINDTTPGSTTTYSSNKIESIKRELSSQIDAIGGSSGGGEVDLSGYVTRETGNAAQITFADGQTFQAKLDAGMLKGDKGDPGEQGPQGIQGQKGDIGNPTDEQVKNAINEAIANGDIVAGGLTSTAQTLLINILRSAVFTSNQSANIALLQSELAKGNSGGSGGGGSETTRYTITNTLNNATTSNNVALVDANSSYTAIIRENDGYTLDAITVTMGGTDITSSAVSGTTITINSVTGNVVITVTTTESGGSSGSEMVTDGLVNYFDFRTAEYNNEGAGGSTIISATQGNGSLYIWANNSIRTQDEYGITQANTRTWAYNGSSVGTTTTSLGTSFTVIFKSYLTNISSPLFDKGYAMGSNTNKMVYVPKYKTTSGTGNVPNTELGTRKDLGYDTVTLIVDGNICKLYFGTELMQTNDGSTISDFQGWYDQLSGVGILGDRNNVHLTQMAVYNKALSEVELVDMIEYLATLEVK